MSLMQMKDYPYMEIRDLKVPDIYTFYLIKYVM